MISNGKRYIHNTSLLENDTEKISINSDNILERGDGERGNDTEKISRGNVAKSTMRSHVERHSRRTSLIDDNDDFRRHFTTCCQHCR